MGAFLINNPKCVFIHIPKNAGSTIRNGIFKQNYEGPVFNEIPNEWEEFFSFAFVRNPYDRLVSAWKMFSKGMQNTKWSRSDSERLNGIDFFSFLELAIDSSIDYQSRHTIESVLKHHTLPQTHPYHCIQHAKFIGKFENLKNDFEYVANIIRLSDYEFEHLNKTQRVSYKNYYDNACFELVTKHYQSDLDAFDYSF
jgi:hypothetical protein